MVDFQIASDLHLEMREDEEIEGLVRRRAGVLVLAGDIYPFAKKDYAQTIAKISEPFDLVLYVPGNHEYYGSPFGKSTEQRIMDMSHSGKLGKTLYMNKQSINVRGMQYIGATLWTNVPDDAPDKMNDYASIYNFSVKKCREAHNDQRAYILHEIARAKKNGAIGAVVITHHAPDPHLSLHATSRSDEHVPYYYANDMSECVTDPFVKAWIHGHTHESYRIRLSPGGPVVGSNGLGYPGENTGFYVSDVMKLKIPSTSSNPGL